MHPRIRLANEEEKSVLRNMDQYYLYEFSRLMPERYCLGSDGVFCDDDYERYWRSSCHFPYLIFSRDELAGFALVHGGNRKFNLDQFFIMAKFQGSGLADDAVGMVFDLHDGQWKVQSFLKNEKSEKFWARIIPAYANGRFTVDLQQPDRTHREYIFLNGK